MGGPLEIHGIFPGYLYGKALDFFCMPVPKFCCGTKMTNQDAKGEAARGQPIVYRIFLASPGDVRDERELSRAIIEQIRLLQLL